VASRQRPSEPPEAFARAIAGLRAVRLRPEIRLAEAPAPQRLAPFALAFTGDIDAAGEELATGRFVVLHNPAGEETWQGDTRVVVYVRALLEPEMANDPFLPAVAWTWLTEALTHRLEPATPVALGGTVTRVLSESFGTMSSRPPSAHVELRASWTPSGDLTAHLEAWGEVLASAAGLPPLPPGVAVLPPPGDARRTAATRPPRRR